MNRQTGGVALFGKAAQKIIKDGPGLALRRLIWRLHWERFERLRSKRARQNAPAPTVVRVLNQDFELHPSLAGVSEELLLFGTHEPLGTQLYLKELSLGNHVIDVGSNLGYWLLSAKSVVGESGRVFGFEPVPSIYAILKSNIQRSGQNNIQIFPCAVGAANGTAQFFESEVPNWGSLIRNDNLLPTGGQSVQVRKLDDVVIDLPDFRPTALRMDVEGAELQVLEGARELLKKYKPCLFIEFHSFLLGWPRVREALLNLRELGYRTGMLIQRTWDQPWMSRWMRERRRWTGPVENLIGRAESPKDPLTESTVSVILHRPGN